MRFSARANAARHSRRKFIDALKVQTKAKATDPKLECVYRQHGVEADGHKDCGETRNTGRIHGRGDAMRPAPEQRLTNPLQRQQERSGR